jgi:N-acyl-D-amino-acid deacylase
LDILIRGAEVLDGLGGPTHRADVGVRSERVVLLAPGRPTRARQTIDAAGCLVVPGFIDIHGHSDLAALAHPDAASRLAAGVTTECVGNCGYGAFPMAGEVLQRRQAEYKLSELTIDWTDLPGYLARADAVGCAINRAVLIGHGNVRGSVVGYGRRRAGRQQLERMCRIVDSCMAAGCAGMSTGLIYPPGMWADAEELVALARVVARHGGLYASHIRNEGDTLLESVREFLDVLRRSGCRGQLSHVKTAEPRNWHKLQALKELLYSARSEGIDLHADRYPYTAGATDLATMVLPRQALGGDTGQVLARLADQSSRRKIVGMIERQKGPDLARWHENVVVSAVGNPAFQACVGKNLRQLTAVFGLSNPTEAAIRLIHDDGTVTQGVHFSMSEENLREIYSWDIVAVGSDSSCRDYFGEPAGERPHPRAYGTPARFIDLTVRKWGMLDWPQAVRRMTSLPARILGLADRGVLRDGAWADLAVLDPKTFTDRATYDSPCHPPAGVLATIVNGQVVWQTGQHTGKRAGKMLRREGAA